MFYIPGFSSGVEIQTCKEKLIPKLEELDKELDSIAFWINRNKEEMKRIGNQTDDESGEVVEENNYVKLQKLIKAILEEEK